MTGTRYFRDTTVPFEQMQQQTLALVQTRVDQYFDTRTQQIRDTISPTSLCRFLLLSLESPDRDEFLWSGGFTL